MALWGRQCVQLLLGRFVVGGVNWDKLDGMSVDASAGKPPVLLVVDMQNGVLEHCWQAAGVIGRIASVVDRARQAGTPVVWVRHSSQSMAIGSREWAIVPQLVPIAGEPIIEKVFGDAFEATNLEIILAGLRAGTVVVCGAQTDACIVSTLFGGLVRGHSMTLIGDAHTTEPRPDAGVPSPDGVIAIVNRIWQHRAAPGRTASVVTSDEVTF